MASFTQIAEELKEKNDALQGYKNLKFEYEQIENTLRQAVDGNCDPNQNYDMLITRFNQLKAIIASTESSIEQDLKEIDLN